MPCNFTFSHYKQILAQARTARVEIIHDVDFPPGNVEYMARIEKEAGISTKYFIRLHAAFYNALSFDSVKLFRRIALEYGHELGLHYEPGYYQQSSQSTGIALEASMLETAYGVPIKYVSIHCPAKGGTIDEKDVPPSLQYYCYTASHYADKKYLSDSGGRWREGCACEQIGKHDSMILLTHPNWWFETTPSENF